MKQKIPVSTTYDVGCHQGAAVVTAGALVDSGDAVVVSPV